MSARAHRGREPLRSLRHLKCCARRQTHAQWSLCRQFSLNSVWFWEHCNWGSGARAHGAVGRSIKYARGQASSCMARPPNTKRRGRAAAVGARACEIAAKRQLSRRPRAREVLTPVRASMQPLWGLWGSSPNKPTDERAPLIGGGRRPNLASCLSSSFQSNLWAIRLMSNAAGCCSQTGLALKRDSTTTPFSDCHLAAGGPRVHNARASEANLTWPRRLNWRPCETTRIGQRPRRMRAGACGREGVKYTRNRRGRALSQSAPRRNMWPGFGRIAPTSCSWGHGEGGRRRSSD